MSASTAETPAIRGGQERPLLFVATPKRVSELLKIKEEDVKTQMASVNGRESLLTELMKRQDEIPLDHADVRTALKGQLDVAAEMLHAEQRYFADIQSPEKKGLLRRAWETIKGFPRNHPYVTALLAAFLLAAGAGYLGYLDFAALWARLRGLSLFGGAGGAATEGVVETVEGTEAATEAVEQVIDLALDPESVVVKTIGRSIEYGGKVFSKENIDELVQILPDLEKNQLIRVARDPSSRASIENILSEALMKKYGTQDVILWDEISNIMP